MLCPPYSLMAISVSQPAADSTAISSVSLATFCPVCGLITRQALLPFIFVFLRSAHSKQWQSQVAHFHQHTVQRRLVDIDPRNDGLSMLDIGDGETIKPLVPLLTEMALDTDEIQFLCHAHIILCCSHSVFSKVLLKPHSSDL